MRDIHQLSGRMGNEMFRDAYIFSQFKKGEIPDVYLQNPKYFEEFKEEIKQRYGDGIGYLPYVAVHLRVGSNPVDPKEPRYSDNPFYVNLSKTGYYIDATNLFPNRKFLVFSDDNELARTYFEGDKFAFADSETDVEAFNQMASCQDHIIANSSFSWWAAFLSPSLNKKVVAPTVDKWHNDGIERTVCPEDWIRI